MVKKRVPEPVESEWIGQWVCVVLHDGSYYVGKVADINNGEVVLHGVRGDGAMQEGKEPERAQVSGFLGSLFGFGGNSSGSFNSFPNGSSAYNGGSGSGGMNWGRIFPAIRIGFNVMQTMMPLLGKFII
ncbi:hypothetical protein PASE110613_05070 [Paenibacillus sediminis]|uniref:Uncharacterized protein n=1 Tax=Paenibacillus sediminis TaxID=664909 RepID=A0ABS4H207_9BACL|nr:hypothetical protein [Paenibacillus sediminis]MBP1936145.1 hypothetical protein [Paenibacillus sediminis]